MLFNTFEFAIFLPVVFLIYWFLLQKNLRLQNFLIVIASYFFYGYWQWKFLLLIFFSTIVDYSIGILLSQSNSAKQRKLLLLTSCFVNLGCLGIFKYYNFFIDSFTGAFSIFGINLTLGSLNILLPVGISFYTFQTLSYTIDVYRRDLKPTKDFIAFAAFVSFFPQLVAGPIERATNLLPQFQQPRIFNSKEATDGLRQILWGLFKKALVADNCARFVNFVFENSESQPPFILVLGVFFFSFQIYGDFSGYSDIAIGAARLFGFNLMKNFAFPYFSRDIAEFWRRWHISLSTWFKDYLYIPLGGSRGSTWLKVRNTFTIFLVSGFWHGANWTFVVWGFLHATYFLPLLLFKKNRKNIDIVARDNWLPSFGEFLKIATTFVLVSFAWIFFRAEDVGHAFSYISHIFSSNFFFIPSLIPNLPKTTIAFVFPNKKRLFLLCR